MVIEGTSLEGPSIPERHGRDVRYDNRFRSLGSASAGVSRAL
jgi:hypothetical protein